jgi:hypothetical protein
MAAGVIIQCLDGVISLVMAANLALRQFLLEVSLQLIQMHQCNQVKLAV